MGFRNGAYATIWEITPTSENVTRGRITTSRKNKNTGEYETDFSGFVSFIGANCAKKAANLQAKDRIKIESTDVSTYYNKEKNQNYTNFNIFEFEKADSGGGNQQEKAVDSKSDPDPLDSIDDDDVPF